MERARILLVEDEHIVREDLRDCLAHLGHDVVACASSGAEALQHVRHLHPDLVLMDIRLKGDMDGIDTAEHLRTQCALPVIYLTAHADEQTLHRAKATAPLGYLVKPFKEADVKAVITMALHKHQLDRRLQESEQWLATTLGSIGDAIVATDHQGRVVFLNRVAEACTGWTLDEARGREVTQVYQVFDSSTRLPLDHPVAAVLRTGTAAPLATPSLLRARDGTERYIDESACPIRNEAGEFLGAVLVFRDVSERLRLAETLRQMYKMEAIGRLAGGVAHEFNNLLTVINGYAEYAMANFAPTGGLYEAITHIRHAGERAASLTRQLLAFGRKQMMTPQVFNLNALVAHLSTMLPWMIGEHIAVRSVLESSPLLVHADPGQVEQILLNLALNARDAMPDGGQLRLQTTAETLEGPTGPLPSDLAPGLYACLTVTDTGYGMGPDVLAHLFEPFFTTKDVGQGTGLGLAAVYGIVKQSGGNIEVASQVGQGTTFWIYLPRVVAPPQGADAVPSLPPVAAGTETILVVEDEPMVRHLAVDLLRHQGYQVVEAESGEDALRLCQHQGPIHLLLTDMLLPGMNGTVMAERVRALQEDIKVLYMSGHIGGALDALPTLEPGMEILEKPFTPAQLLRKVRDVLDRPRGVERSDGGG